MTDLHIELIPADSRSFAEIETVYQVAIRKMTGNGLFLWDYGQYPNAQILTDDIRRGNMFSAKDILSGRIAGCVVLNRECDIQYDSADWLFRSEKPLIVHRLCIHPDFQNRGYARGIMKEVLRKAAADGFDAVRLDAFSQNTPALTMYEKLGFRKAGEAYWQQGTFYLFEKAVLPLKRT